MPLCPENHYFFIVSFDILRLLSGCLDLDPFHSSHRHPTPCSNMRAPEPGFRIIYRFSPKKPALFPLACVTLFHPLDTKHKAIPAP